MLTLTLRFLYSKVSQHIATPMAVVLYVIVIHSYYTFLCLYGKLKPQCVFLKTALNLFFMKLSLCAVDKNRP